MKSSGFYSSGGVKHAILIWPNVNNTTAEMPYISNWCKGAASEHQSDCLRSDVLAVKKQYHDYHTNLIIIKNVWQTSHALQCKCLIGPFLRNVTCSLEIEGNFLSYIMNTKMASYSDHQSQDYKRGYGSCGISYSSDSWVRLKLPVRQPATCCFDRRGILLCRLRGHSS